MLSELDLKDEELFVQVDDVLVATDTLKRHSCENANSSNAKLHFFTLLTKKKENTDPNKIAKILEYLTPRNMQS